MRGPRKGRLTRIPGALLTALSWLLPLVAGIAAAADARADAPTVTAAAQPAASDLDQAAALAAAGRYEELKLLLERRVLLQPAAAADWFDLAVAHAHLGEWDTARRLLDYIEAELDPPAELRRWIAGYRLRIAAAAPIAAGRNWIASLAVLHGAESNVNAAPAISALTLVQGGLPVTLELDERFRPRNGQTSLVELRGEAQLPHGRDTFTLAGDLRQRHVLTHSEDNTRQLQVLAGARRELGWSQLSATVAYQHADWGGNPVYRGTRAQLAVETDWAGCRLLAAAEDELRRFPGQPWLDGRAPGAVGGLGCPLAGGRWQLIARTAMDRPAQPGRAGGRQTRRELGLAVQQALPRGARLDLTAALALSHDAEAYSPLFGETVRRIDRRSLRAEYIHPLGEGIEALVRFEILRQGSNVDLFLLKNNALHAGVRKIF